MTEVARITFYSIEKCGYYKYNSELPEFGSISDILQQLQQWVSRSGCLLNETCTYQIDESDSTLPTYCFNIVQNSSNDDYLLTTWNGTPTSDGKVASVNGRQPVGRADVNLSEVPPGCIPGYATYFWFVPSRNVFATVCFRHIYNGHSNLVKYLREFMAKLTSFVVTTEQEGSTNVIGYCRPGQMAEPLNPRFVSNQYRLPGRLDYLRSNRNFIQKVIRKNKLNPEIPDSTGLLEKMLCYLGIVNSPVRENPLHFKYELEYTPSGDELETIIVEWNRNHQLRWDDVGFTFQNDRKPFWLSHSIARHKFDLNISRENPEIVNSDSLLEAITNQRGAILELLGDPK